MDRDSIHRAALDILTGDLKAHGNVLSALHTAALAELTDTLAGYATGTVKGRQAFPLPTGMGKTSAVVAFLAALHRLDLPVPVSVAASKVEALCVMKRELLAHGVPEALIGLKHSVADASEPSTGAQSRLFQLVTHARVRGGTDFDLFGSHQGQARALCIYDETFMRSDAFAFRARAVYAAVSVFRAETEGDPDPQRELLLGYLLEAEARIRSALGVLQATGDAHANGAPISLPELESSALPAFLSVLGCHAWKMNGYDDTLRGLLQLASGSLRVVGTEQGEGLVTAREVVPLGLSNVVVLDASAPIRELAKLDPTVQVAQGFDLADLKSFEAVEVHQLLSPGGRSSISHSLGADRKEASAVAREVADIIRKGWETERAFLIFAFVPRGRLDMVEELKRDLHRSGIDLEARTAEGQPRINWRTWGSETSSNGLEFCTSVIMAGVLHRSHLDLAASVRGQTGNPAEPTTSARLRELVESEIAHCIYQGASRGACRRIDNGKASPMRLWFIHQHPDIKTTLDRVMPGAQWAYPEPTHLKKAKSETKAAQLLSQLLGYLETLPEGTTRTSTRTVKAAMGLPTDGATAAAFKRAVGLLDHSTHGWTLQERSLVRGATAHGFDSQPTT